MENEPILIKGGRYTDERGRIHFNNDFDLTEVKRVYTIENWSTENIRGWQGHKIERRWFSAVNGSFRIKLTQIDNWDKPSRDCKCFSFELNVDKLDVLCVPKGYVSNIQSLEVESKLMVMADYLMGEIQDEYRFDLDYFKE